MPCHNNPWLHPALPMQFHNGLLLSSPGGLSTLSHWGKYFLWELLHCRKPTRLLRWHANSICHEWPASRNPPYLFLKSNPELRLVHFLPKRPPPEHTVHY